MKIAMSTLPRLHTTGADNTSLPATTSAWARPNGLADVLAHWQQSNRTRDCFTSNIIVPATEARYAAMPQGLNSGIQEALASRGIAQLFEHQARAFEAAQSRRAVVISTPTASGKSLCFHLPVLQSLANDPDARALYIYPTKALARDQEASLLELMRASNLAGDAMVFDGDTPADARRVAKTRARVLLSNPDMLHAGILPGHAAWATLLANLKYVVVDEMHVYTGVFGSHVANVLRRLRRLARFHGSDPVFLGATATIRNPQEHGARLFDLLEDNVEVIDQSGAPRGPKRVLTYNPPIVNAELGLRASYIKQTVRLTRDLIEARVPSIVFAGSRNNVEVILRYLREQLPAGVSPSAVQSYRGGYLPEERRAVERSLRAGEVLCVVATSALELGIDIGALDAVVCAGYPGSVSGLWQRFGRAGRRGETALCLMVGSSAPVDQYLMRDPTWLTSRGAEEARIDPDNPEIFVQHLKCAAFEQPIPVGASFGLAPAEMVAPALEHLRAHRTLHAASGAYHWASDQGYPAQSVSLRAASWDNVVVIDTERDVAIAEMDWPSAHTMLHTQAIYQHGGETFEVERFDYENHKAFVRKVTPDYYTDAMSRTRIRITDIAEEFPLCAGDTAPIVGHGDVSTLEKVVGYKKIKFYTHENAGYGEVHLPEQHAQSTGFWLTLPGALCEEIPGHSSSHDSGQPSKVAVVDALRGVGKALRTVASLAFLCDPRDLRTSLGDTARGGEQTSDDAPGAEFYDPTLFVYETIPSGIGLSGRIFEHRAELIARALHLVRTCPCDDGCPACVNPSEQGPRKETAVRVLSYLSKVAAPK